MDLPRGRPLTAEDLELMPDDGHRYELLDGTLIVTPGSGEETWTAESPYSVTITPGRLV